MTQFDFKEAPPEGMSVAAERVADTGGRHPIAWLDARGNLMPVEAAVVYPALPDGARYIYDREEVLREAGRMVILADTSDVAAMTGQSPKPPMTSSVSRAAKRAFMDPQGRG